MILQLEPIFDQKGIHKSDVVEVARQRDVSGIGAVHSLFGTCIRHSVEFVSFNVALSSRRF